MLKRLLASLVVLGSLVPIRVSATTLSKTIIATSTDNTCGDGGSMNPNAISVTQGDKIDLIFQVPADDAYTLNGGGMDIHINGSTYPVVRGGSTPIPEFTAGSSNISFYGTWPSSGCMKGSGTITLNAPAPTPLPSPTPNPNRSPSPSPAATSPTNTSTPTATTPAATTPAPTPTQTPANTSDTSTNTTQPSATKPVTTPAPTTTRSSRASFLPWAGVGGGGLLLLIVVFVVWLRLRTKAPKLSEAEMMNQALQAQPPSQANQAQTSQTADTSVDNRLTP